MKHKLLLLSMLGSVFVVHAQSVVPQVIATAGGSGQNAQNKLSWTVGEPVTATLSNGNNTLTQGFQQPNLQLVNGIQNAQDADLVLLYPNPTNDELFLQLKKTPDVNSSVHLFDVSGKLIYDLKISGITTKLSLTGLASGTYYLSVQLIQSPAKNFTIIKQN